MSTQKLPCAVMLQKNSQCVIFSFTNEGILEILLLLSDFIKISAFYRLLILSVGEWKFDNENLVFPCNHRYLKNDSANFFFFRQVLGFFFDQICIKNTCQVFLKIRPKKTLILAEKKRKITAIVFQICTKNLTTVFLTQIIFPVHNIV